MIALRFFTRADSGSRVNLRTKREHVTLPDLATSLSLESLERKGLIKYTSEQDEDSSYVVCSLTSRGLDWMLENKDRFKLSPLRDEDIPF